MKINELVEKFKKNKMLDIAKEIETQTYISIETKREMAKLVLDNCTTVVDGAVRIDSIERYILFTIATIGMHTNLEFTHEDDDVVSAIDDYDALCESGLLIKVIDTFKDDYASCQEILNMMTADKMQENITIEKKIIQVLDGLQKLLGDGLKDVAQKLNLDEMLGGEQIDTSKLLDLYNMFK